MINWNTRLNITVNPPNQDAHANEAIRKNMAVGIHQEILTQQNDMIPCNEHIMTLDYDWDNQSYSHKQWDKRVV